MWCVNCQHGHIPLQDGTCPCCGVILLTQEQTAKQAEEKKELETRISEAVKTETTSTGETITMPEKPKGKKRGPKPKNKTEDKPV